MLKKFTPILLLGLVGCSSFSDNHFVAANGETVSYEEIATKKIPYGHDPDLFYMQAHAKTVVAKENCNYFLENDSEMLNKVIKEIESGVTIYKRDKDSRKKYLEIHEGLKTYYKKEELNQICQEFKKSNQNYIKNME